jgi:hypothetical protein
LHLPTPPAAFGEEERPVLLTAFSAEVCHAAAASFRVAPLFAFIYLPTNRLYSLGALFVAIYYGDKKKLKTSPILMDRMKMSEILDKMEERRNTLYYFGIGTASNLELKGRTHLEQGEMHQYPQNFVGPVHDLVKDAIFVQFDAMFEDVPYITTHNFLSPNETDRHKSGPYWNKISDHHWKFSGPGYYLGRDSNDIYRIDLYVFKHNVSFRDDEYSHNIKDFVVDLLQRQAETGSYALFHDFSGHNPMYMNCYLRKHILSPSRTLIDFSYGDDIGCMFNTKSQDYRITLDEAGDIRRRPSPQLYRSRILSIIQNLLRPLLSCEKSASSLIVDVHNRDPDFIESLSATSGFSFLERARREEGDPSFRDEILVTLLNEIENEICSCRTELPGAENMELELDISNPSGLISQLSSAFKMISGKKF